MTRPILITATLLLFSIFAHSTTFYSILDGMGMPGDWSNGGYWSYTQGGAPCGTAPGASDIIFVAEDINLDVSYSVRGTLTILTGASLTTATNELSVRAGGTLNSDGHIEVYDLIFYNGSFVDFKASSTTTVLNDFTNMNNSDDINIDGMVDVAGEFYNGNGGVIVGGGGITAGTFTGTGTTFGISPNESIPAGSSIPFALPVELLSFTATVSVDSGLVLNWTTASEINNSHFEVERSQDGQTFITVAFVEGSGNSTELLHYSAEDPQPLNGLAYYRLKQVDYDGTTAYSDIIPFKYESLYTGEMIVFPNPATTNDNIQVQFEGLEPDKEVLVVVNNILGQVQYSKVVFTDFSGSVLEAVDPYDNLAPGTYIIIGTSQDKIYKKKFIIR